MTPPFRQLGGAVGSGRGPTLPFFRIGDLTAAAFVGMVAVVAGVIAVKSIQAATALVLLVGAVGLYTESRRAGMVGLWSIWLLAPILRRVLALSAGTPTADPLSLLPFVATGALALLELRRSTMNVRARNTLAIAVLGFLIGAPMGLLNEPQGFAFGLLSYVSGVGAIALGWADAREGGVPTLTKVLVWAMPALAAYGILQYFVSLTSWDSNWIETVNLVSIGSPQEGHIRIFSTLNSPGTFAFVLAVALILGLGYSRRPLASLGWNVLLVVALALTYVRSAWLSVAAGVIVFAAVARGRSAKRLVIFIAVFLAFIVVAGGSNPTTRAFTERITSLGSPGEDKSTQARLDFTGEQLPNAIREPLGSGLGSAGQGKDLGEGGGGNPNQEATDNGYLAQLYELGPVGFLLVLIAMVRIVASALRAAGTSEEGQRQARAAVLAALLALMLANAGGDILYGITGAFFWYLGGLALASEEERGETALNGPLEERPG